MKIGEKIRNAREDLDLLQSDVSNQIPMNQSNYSKIERDVQEPSIEQLRRICQILKLDPRYLLNLEEFESISADDMQLLNETKAFINKYSKKIWRAAKIACASFYVAFLYGRFIELVYYEFSPHPLTSLIFYLISSLDKTTVSSTTL